MYQDFINFIENDFNEQVLLNEKEFDKTVLDYKFRDNNKRVKELIFKIDSFLKRNPQLSGSTTDDVISEAQMSKFFKATLLKSVTRQGKSETLQKNFIETNTDNKIRLEILPKNGENSYRIDHEGIIKRGIKKNKLKSLDSFITYEHYRCFAIQKLTHDFGLATYTSGGAQDNQLNDAILNGVDMYKGENPLIIILDGNYYHTKLLNGLTKIEHLKLENKNKHVIITDSFSIKNDLDYHIHNINIDAQEII